MLGYNMTMLFLCNALLAQCLKESVSVCVQTKTAFMRAKRVFVPV